MLRAIAFIAVLSGILALSVGFTPSQAATAPPKPVTGCLNQTLTDGFWNVKVTSFTLGIEPDSSIPAWGATFSLANARTKTSTPTELGVGQPQVILKDGTAVDMTTSSELAYQKVIYSAFKPNTQMSGTYWYRVGDTIAKATTLLFPVSPNNSVYNTPFGYPVKNPSFSVDLTCDKSKT